MNILFITLFLTTTVSAIIVSGGGGRHSHSHPSSSSSSGSWSSEEHGHGHGRPHRQKPTRAPRIGCEQGWLYFERPSGVWCILVGSTGVTNGYMSQQDAQNVCAQRGATLTGFQNDNERMTVANEALRQLPALGRQIAGLWLGATNNPGCKVNSCGAFNTFRWTDGDTTGTGGFKWGINEPDNLNWPGATACIQQFIVQPGWVRTAQDYESWRGAFAHGDLDKFQCTSPASPVTRMYACGKKGAPQ